MDGNIIKHKLYVCDLLCDNQGSCNYCDGDLSHCVVCGGAESSLTTHCRGEKIDEIMLRQVSMGQADYVDGEWIRPNVEWRTTFNG